MRAAPFEIPGATELERLVARSRLIGADPALVLHGGGNTSSKIVERDHVGRERLVLRIKGTGMDLATIGPDGFAGLFLDELLLLQERESMPDEEVIDYVARCLVDPRAPRPSIETLLHAFVPATHVDHVHADAVCALANGRKSRSIVHDALGKDVASIGYVRPGFELSRRVAEACSDHRAAVLLKHGLVTWGETHEASYGLMLDLVERAETYLSERTRRPRPRTVPDIGDDDLAEILTRLRGRLSRTRRQVLLVDRSQRWLADRRDVADIASARATPDHLLRISTGGIVVGTAAEVEPAVDGFESAYRAYFDRNRVRLPAGTPMRSPLPNVILVPGLGCVTASSDARSARVNAELALHSHSVGAHLLDGLDELEGLSDEEAFDVDYWPSELYKLTLAPPPPEFSGHVVLVTGAASGIGREIAIDLGRRGAHLVIGDLDGEGLAQTASEIPLERVVCVEGDVTREDVVDRLVQTAVHSFGGLDAVVSNAGIAATGRLAELSRDDWQRSIEVNATSHFLLTRRVWPVFEHQGIGGSIVYVASKNAFSPGAGFGAYSAAKAAEIQIARIAALEGGPLKIRANVVNPDAVFGGSRLWDEKVRAERAAAHGVRPDELETFYAARNLLGVHVSTHDVAEAVAFLVSDRARATTGCVLTVDGGVASAFPR